MITLRPATPADSALLRAWDEQEHVIAGHTDADWGWETELARSPDWREQLIIETDRVPIGFVQIIDPARELVRELKAVGGDLKTLRLALTGRDRGPELAALLEALPKEETLRRVDAAL